MYRILRQFPKAAQRSRIKTALEPAQRQTLDGDFHGAQFDEVWLTAKVESEPAITMSGVINAPSRKPVNILLSGKPDLLSALLPPDGRIRMSVQIGSLKIPFSFRYQTIEPLIRPSAA